MIPSTARFVERPGGPPPPPGGDSAPEEAGEEA